jgi:N-acetylmuramoyl-L-alanine amidase
MGRILTREEWRKRRRRNRIILLLTTAVLTLTILVCIGLITYRIIRGNPISSQGLLHDLTDDLFGNNREGIATIDKKLYNGVEIQGKFLTPNEHSRPQTPLKDINSIVVHYTANPGTTAVNNRNYFEGLSVKHTTYASSHYIIGLEGEVIQCIPLNEISFASNNRNKDSVSIECCHPDETGKFNKETYNSLVALTAALCIEFNLGEKDIIRHYDITEKLCPLYYVENEEEWYRFRREVMALTEQRRAANEGSTNK